MPKPQEPCDFGLFGERQLDICDLIQAPAIRQHSSYHRQRCLHWWRPLSFVLS